MSSFKNLTAQSRKLEVKEVLKQIMTSSVLVFSWDLLTEHIEYRLPYLLTSTCGRHIQVLNWNSADIKSIGCTVLMLVFINKEFIVHFHQIMQWHVIGEFRALKINQVWSRLTSHLLPCLSGKQPGSNKKTESIEGVRMVGDLYLNTEDVFNFEQVCCVVAIFLHYHSQHYLVASLFVYFLVPQNCSFVILAQM